MNSKKIKNYFGKWISSVFFLMILNCFFSCKTVPTPPEKEIKLSREILGAGQFSAVELADFFLMNNQQIEKDFILEFAGFYIQEAAMENINSDVAFAQMCLETGFLRFGGLVQPDFHNYCGLGAMDGDHPGEKFETEQLGVRAHIQHLQAYATTQDVQLNNQLIDPRYHWVHKTKFVTDIFGLTGTWATDPNYGNKIDEIISRMEVFIKNIKK